MKNIRHHLAPRLLGAAIAAAALIVPAIASAQVDPSYATGDQGGQNQQIQGTVSAINGTWNITLADANGYSDSIALHQGTIINPTGLTLEPGMNVTIDGYADGSNFDAVEIDTPYQYQGPAPVAVYYGAGEWYPGYAYGWGPSFSLFFDVNSRSFERRSFDYNGRARQAIAPPSGWQDRPHGYIGSVHPIQQRGRTEAQPQQRTYAQGQQQRAYVQPQQQQTRFAPTQQPTRSFAQPVQQRQTRSFAAPQQQRSFSAPQQARNFAPQAQQQRSFSAPAQRSAPAARGGGQTGGDHHR
jgi:hypothetical protein